MRIEAYNQVQQLYNNSKVKATSATNTAKRSDGVQISSFGKDIQTAKQAVDAVADVREDVVTPLKNAVQSGTYNVSSSDFAGKLLAKYNESESIL